MERVLIAEDDPHRRQLLAEGVGALGLAVELATDSRTSWRMLAEADAPQLVILSSGELCRRLQQIDTQRPLHVILVGSPGGLACGADDCLSEPWHPDELRVRVGIGQRLLALQRQVAGQKRALARALIPMCSYCKDVRSGKDEWQAVESFLEHHASLEFTHGVCPGCYDSHARPQLEAARACDGPAPRKSPEPEGLPA